MKIALFTDIHGNLEALQTILEDIKKQKVDKIICLGDTIGLGPNSKECIDLLIENKIDMAYGNHELYCLKGTNIDPKIDGEELLHHKWIKENLTKKELDFISSCPPYYECTIEYDNKIPDKKIIFSHYLIKDRKLDYPFEKEHLKEGIDLWLKYFDYNKEYIIGHLHNSFDENEVEGISYDYIEKIDALPNIIVLDSAGCTVNDETSYMIVTVKKSIEYQIVKLKYDRQTFENKIKSIDFPDKNNILKFFYGIED